jgi:hypothetical protein
MIAFKSHRVTHEYTQTNLATPEKVFPLLCPVREAEWVPDWQYRLIYSESGIAENGCIFTTPNLPASGPQGQVAPETSWIVTEYDPTAFRIGFVWMDPGLVVAEIRIQLTPTPHATTLAYIRYRYTGLSADGNREVERYDQKWFLTKMQGWETAINHYLRTGKKIDSPAWE